MHAVTKHHFLSIFNAGKKWKIRWKGNRSEDTDGIHSSVQLVFIKSRLIETSHYRRKYSYLEGRQPGSSILKTAKLIAVPEETFNFVEPQFLREVKAPSFDHSITESPARTSSNRVLISITVRAPARTELVTEHSFLSES